jgi:DNA primase
MNNVEIPYFIEQILENRKIINYLEDRGIFAKRNTGDKSTFCCPVHSGDNDPSFVVYLNSEYENYYCYGCHSGGSIINLVSDMEKISVRAAISKLAIGLDIKSVDILDAVIDQLKKINIIKDNFAVEALFLQINRSCYDFLKTMDFDSEEVIFFEEVYKKIDKTAMAKDETTLEGMQEFLMDKGFPFRVDKCFNRKQNQVLLDYEKAAVWENLK